MEIIESTLAKGRSTSDISFPYSDVGDGVKVAEGLLKGGGTPLSRDQLAAAMGQTPGSGSFNTKVNTARIFGVIETSGGKYQLTELGFEIVDPDRQREALTTAFLNVPLYKKVYEEFRGKRLPPRPHGLERAFVTFGVAPKQTQKARLAFEKSARIAGFYPGGDEDRLVMPFGASSRIASSGGDDGEIEVVHATPTPAPVRPEAAPKALEYQLVDLLTAEGIGESESDAIWTLVRFLSKKKTG
jgi:hypothetical protein